MKNLCECGHDEDWHYKSVGCAFSLNKDEDCPCKKFNTLKGIKAKKGCGKASPDGTYSVCGSKCDMEGCNKIHLCSECQSPKRRFEDRFKWDSEDAKTPKKGCGKLVPAGIDKVDGYPLHNTCGFMDYLCDECQPKACGKDYIREDNGHRTHCRRSQLCPECQTTKGCVCCDWWCQKCSNLIGKGVCSCNKPKKEDDEDGENIN